MKTYLLSLVVLASVGTAMVQPSPAFGWRAPKLLAQGEDKLVPETLAISSLAALQNPQIQAELKMSTDQRDEVASIAARAKADVKAMADRARRNPFTANRDKLMKQAREIMAKAEASAVDRLEADQVKRLREISVQLGGNLAAANLVVAAELGLTSEQKSAIAEKTLVLQQRSRKKAGGIKPEDISEAKAQVERILTAQQIQKLQTMAGEPFKLESGR